MALTVHILADNNSLPGFVSQWGFSCLLETDAETWLLDTGRDSLFLKNAEKMKLVPQDAKGLFLSHAHYDHTGGLQSLLEAGFSGEIIGHPKVFRSTTTPKMPHAGPSLSLTDLPDGKFHPVESHQSFPGEISFVTKIPRIPGNHQSIQGFSLDLAGAIPDTMPDDAFILYESTNGPVLIFGCCHSGIANSFACLRQRYGIDHVYGVLGGMHLHDASQEVIEQSARIFDKFHVQEIHAGHCTGEESRRRLANLCRGRVSPLAAGLSIVF
ncbi:MAG: MBL fold metallo-hydrolase [Desulfovibrio sp.]|uniref:MBL fold metallo-hydrolase n=1 Tax=Desulfovibrio sp. 7SRBS1 TaxID=3378064 RepID=UPI003B3C50DD